MERSDRYSCYSNPDDSVKNDKKGKKDKLEDRDKTSKNKSKITFETFDKNYARAMRFYTNQQYLSAARIFEELYPLTLGTPHADTILFTFANCYYLNQDYELAAFHFKDYSRRYAGTPKAEEAYFLCVKSIYYLSPTHSLDQFETKYAIEEIGYFFKQYPNSRYVEECNAMLDQLREKLARKDFEMAKLYYYTENYAAVQIYVKNFMKDHPASNLAPEASYLLIKSNFDFARKSVDSKQLERYLQCLDAFATLNANYPGSPFVEQATKYAVDAEKAIEKINAKKQR
jgi:outer membrane protein assembly factor BamD